MPTITGPRNNYREGRGTIVIPTVSTSYCKIIITDDNGVEYTVMNTYSGLVTENFTISGAVSLVATEGIGSFGLELVNDNGRFYNLFDGGEYVRIYMDDTDASTLVFYGRIDNVTYNLNSSNGFYIEVAGRECPELVDKTITGIQTAATADSCLGNIFYENYSYLTLQFWNGTEWITGTYNSITRLISWNGDSTSFPDTLINIAYQNKKGISVISEIMTRANLDGYLYFDETLGQQYYRCFIRESINNSMAISYGVNLIGANGYGSDNNELYNKIVATGKKESDNILLLRTKEDLASQADLWVKDKVIDDSDSTSMTAINDRADSELSQSTIVTPSGTFSAISLTSIKPGELIQLNIPYVVNDLQRVTKITHNIGDFISTTVDVTKKSTQLGDLFVQSFNPDEITSIANINNMRDSYTVYFDDDENIMSHNDTEEVDGRLQLVSTAITGTSDSAVIVTDYDITSCEFRKYENYSTNLDEYYVTNDGGNTWEQITIDGTIHTFASPGKEIAFRMILNRTATTDPTPQYESVCLLYK